MPTDANDPRAPAGRRGLADGRWEQVLGELEARVDRWRAALDGAAPYPDDFQWPEDLGRCPDHLADRARRINAAQHDVQGRLALRRQALAALLRDGGRPGGTRQTPLFVDQRS